ncbi:hypothetical protein [Xenophilus azovorans]|uniref:hypothetical protein n=1 Tax=Xenophilus sp. TaxID=1873499 RepID=UPI0012ECC025
MFGDGVEHRQQLAHAGDQGDLLALAGDPPALAAWFAGDAAAQAAARHEMLASIAETHFDLGAWEWKE